MQPPQVRVSEEVMAMRGRSKFVKASEIHQKCSLRILHSQLTGRRQIDMKKKNPDNPLIYIHIYIYI